MLANLIISTQICRIVCKSAWGKLSEKTTESGGDSHTERGWTLVHDQLTFTKPENPSLLANVPEGETADPASIITYMDYIDRVCPKKKGEDGQPDAATE